MADIEIKLSEDAPDPYPDCGARGPAYRLWRAKEAMAQAEKRLSSQKDQLALYQGRATSVLGWISAEALGTAAMVASHITPQSTVRSDWCWIGGGLGVFIPAVIAAWHLTGAFPARAWSFSGISATWLLTDHGDQSEMTMVEEMAREHADGVADNDKVLSFVWSRLRKGWGWFLATPIIGIITAIVFRTIFLMK